MTNDRDKAELNRQATRIIVLVVALEAAVAYAVKQSDPADPEFMALVIMSQAALQPTN